MRRARSLCAGLVLCIALVLGAYTRSARAGGSRSRTLLQGPPPCICPDIYSPVCSTKNQTFSNECQMDCAHQQLAYQGTCHGRRLLQATAGDCFTIYKPVCGVDGKTYPNDCSLNAAGVQKAHDGSCDTPCTCDGPLDPVCDQDAKISYANACVAKCQGVTNIAKGACPFETCTFLCNRNYDPVCGTDGQTYNSTCWLKCSNAIFAYKGECKPYICPMVVLPVCGTDGKTYQNACLMLKAGVKKASDGACPKPCVCNLHRYKPVCDTATNTSYVNACVAKSQGVTQYTCGACPKRPCNFLCYNLYAPVCGTDHTTYSNICQLRCANAIFAYPGECGTCTEKSPVCWKGKTYDNVCSAICKGAKSKDVKSGACA